MEIELWHYGLLFLGGLVSGWINVLAGGGSIMTLPVMLFIGLPAPVANGTNRIGIIFQNLSAVYGFFREGFSSFKLSLTLSICASIGAIFGAKIGVQVDGVIFNYVLAAVMIAVMLAMMFGNTSTQNNEGSTGKNLVLGHILMIGAGLWGGFIQIGVGFILMPILNRIMCFDLKHTNMHKVFIALTYSIFALIVFAAEVTIVVSVGIALAIGSIIGGYIGAHTTIKKGDVWIKTVMYLTLTAMIIKLIFFS